MALWYNMNMITAASDEGVPVYDYNRWLMS